MITIDQADRIQRIGTPIIVLLAVLLASFCATGCFAEAGGVAGDSTSTGAQPPHRDIPRPPSPDASSGPDGTSGTDAGTTGVLPGSSSSEAGESTSTTGAETDDSGSTDAGQEESSSTGVWVGYDEAHCDADCPPGDVQYDAVVDACICGPYCTDDDDCGWPATCEGGRCGISCVDNSSCPYGTAPGFVCGQMPGNGEMVCMYWMEGP